MLAAIKRSTMIGFAAQHSDHGPLSYDIVEFCLMNCMELECPTISLKLAEINNSYNQKEFLKYGFKDLFPNYGPSSWLKKSIVPY